MAKIRNNSRQWVTKVLLTRRQIEKRIRELAFWVNETYKDSNDLIMIGLLKGSIPFMAQLMKDVKVNYVLDFMAVSTYSGDVKPSHNLKIILDLKQDIENKDVLIVEDIIDSGQTLQKIVTMMKEHHPKSIRILTLLDKPAQRKADLQPDAFGFIVPDEFLVGYGLDVKEKLRGLPFVGVFDMKKLSSL